MIGAKMGFSFDPSTMTLWKLINLKLHEESKMAIIRGISEIATKEYAVLTGLESLDKDIRAAEFTLHKHKDSVDTNIVLKLSDLISSFEDYSTRLQVLRQNPFMKNFYEKLQDIERVVNFVLECLSEWQVFQRHWIYLEEIFSLPEI